MRKAWDLPRLIRQLHRVHLPGMAEVTRLDAYICPCIVFGSRKSATNPLRLVIPRASRLRVAGASVEAPSPACRRARSAAAVAPAVQAWSSTRARVPSGHRSPWSHQTTLSTKYRLRTSRRRCRLAALLSERTLLTPSAMKASSGLPQPLAWRASYRYALFCCSPFG
jgi:hypothetical protein